MVAIANAGDGSVRLLRGAELASAGTIALDDDADNVRIDPRSGFFVVGYGSGGLATIDPVRSTIVARISLRAHPEGFQLTPDGRRALVNVPEAREIAVVDLSAGRQIASWPLLNLRANFPMALDAEGGLAAVVTRSPPRLVLIDATSGRVLGAMSGCGDADDVFFDTRRQRIYVSCGDGHLDVWQRSSGGLERVASIVTSSGARTSLFVPALDRLFVAARAGALGFGNEASILVFRPAD
ncbi:MAG: YncE family protein [Rhodopila sp.]